MTSAVRDFIEAELKAFDTLNEAAGKKYGNRFMPVHRFVLAHGKMWIPASLPDGIKRAPKGNCFQNAYNLADKGKGQYVEGFAMLPSIGFPINHAWVVTPEGTVIDPTWDDPAHSEYFGVLVPLDVLREEVCRWGYYGILDGPTGPNLKFMTTFVEAMGGKNADVPTG